MDTQQYISKKEIWEVKVFRPDSSFLRFDHNPTIAELPQNESLVMEARVIYLDCCDDVMIKFN